MAVGFLADVDHVVRLATQRCACKKQHLSYIYIYIYGIFESVVVLRFIHFANSTSTLANLLLYPRKKHSIAGMRAPKMIYIYIEYIKKIYTYFYIPAAFQRWIHVRSVLEVYRWRHVQGIEIICIYAFLYRINCTECGAYTVMRICYFRDLDRCWVYLYATCNSHTQKICLSWSWQSWTNK